MSTPTVGFRNGDLVLRNISFDYKKNPQDAQPGIITADAQLLIGCVNSNPNPDIAMTAGVLKSTGATIAVTYDYPDINLEVTGSGLFKGLIGATNGVTAVPNGDNKVIIDSANGTLVVNGGGSTIDLNALPTIQDHLKININGLTDVSPTVADPSKFLFTASAGITLTNPSANTINFAGSGAGFGGLIGATNGVTAVPNGDNKVIIDSTNGTVIVNGGGSTIDLNALPTVQDHLKININGATDVSPTAADPSKFLFTATGGMTITNPLPNTINFDSAGGGGGTLNTLTPDIGGVVNPSAGNINVFGLPILAGQTVSLQTSTYNDTSPTLRIKAPNCSLFIVDADPLYGTHTTIQSAVDDCALIGTAQYVFIRPGTYIEDISLPQNVSLVNFAGDEYSCRVIIRGKMTVATGVASSATGIQFENPSGSLIDMTAGTMFFTLIDCAVFASGGTAFLLGPSTNFIMDNCTGNLQSALVSYFTAVGVNGGNCAITLYSCTLFNSLLGTTANTLTYCNLNVYNTRFYGNIVTTGSAAFELMFSHFGAFNSACFALTGGTGVVCTDCSFVSGSGTALTIGAGTGMFLYNCFVSSSNATAMSGAGFVNYTPIIFNLTNTITVTTQTPIGSIGPRIPFGDGKCQLMSGSGSPNGVVTAPLGSIYSRSDVGASINNRTFVNINGGTAWTAFLTAA